MARRSGITVRVEGLDELRRALAELDEDVTAAAKRAIRESAESVRDDTSSRVRIDTGNLSDSVEVRYEDGGLSAKVGWFDSDDYYAHFHEFGTSSIPANPALGPSIEIERGHIVDRLREHVRRSTR